MLVLVLLLNVVDIKLQQNGKTSLSLCVYCIMTVLILIMMAKNKSEMVDYDQDGNTGGHAHSMSDSPAHVATSELWLTTGLLPKRR